MATSLGYGMGLLDRHAGAEVPYLLPEGYIRTPASLHLVSAASRSRAAHARRTGDVYNSAKRWMPIIPHSRRAVFTPLASRASRHWKLTSCFFKLMRSAGPGLGLGAERRRIQMFVQV